MENNNNSLIKVSLSRQDKAPDRRRTPRIVAMKLVKLGHHDTEGLAYCRDISDGGMRVTLATPLAPGTDVEIALSPGVRLCARVIWARGWECGVAFAHRIDSAALIGSIAVEARLTQSSEIPASARPRTLSPPRPGGAPRGAFRAGLTITIVDKTGCEEHAFIGLRRPKSGVLPQIGPQRRPIG